MTTAVSDEALRGTPRHRLSSLPPGGRWRRRRRKELSQLVFLEKVYFDAFSLTRLRRELPPGGSHENDTPPYGLEAPQTVILSAAKNLPITLRSRISSLEEGFHLKNLPPSHKGKEGDFSY